MSILNFTLSPESLSKLHDALVCLGKFGDTVTIEATHDKLVLTALNSTKSAYASFTLIGSKFFSKYHYKAQRTGNANKDKFTCKILNKALLSVFKGRADPSREKDTAIERCDVSVEDGEGKARSRFIVKIICRHGVLKTYRLTFEAVAPMHALFVKESATNTWVISSRALREFVEHFGPGTEQLDIHSGDGRVSFTSYTEKLMSGNEILKQPLHTTIAVDTLEFGEFSVEDNLHIIISVKDFKAIVSHAGITNTVVKALYSRPTSPMQLTYGEEGISTEFILMTIGESRSASATPAPNGAHVNSKRPASRPLEATSSSKRIASKMPPPPTNGGAASFGREASRARITKPEPPPPQPSMQSNELFMPLVDEDQQWEPADFDGDGDRLQWDQDVEKNPTTVNSGRELSATNTQSRKSHSADADLPPTQRLAPTQRLSEIRGMFD